MSIVNESFDKRETLSKAFWSIYFALKKLGIAVVDPFFGGGESITFDSCFGLEFGGNLKVFTTNPCLSLMRTSGTNPKGSSVGQQVIRMVWEL
jgi:hypothetical protein